MELVGLTGDWKILNSGKFTCDQETRKDAISTSTNSLDDCKKAAESSGLRYFFFQTKEQRSNTKGMCQIYRSCNLRREAAYLGTTYYNPKHEGNKYIHYIRITYPFIFFRGSVSFYVIVYKRNFQMLVGRRNASHVM